MPESQFLTCNFPNGREIRTCFQDTGSSVGALPPMVLIHGVGMSKAFWGPQIEHFSRSRRVIVYDTLGHGGSSLPSAAGDLSEYSDQLLALLDHLGVDAADLVGHSMGSLVSLEFALAHPGRVARLAALNAVFCRSEAQSAAVIGRARALRDADMGSGIEPTLERWFGNPIPAELQGVAEWVRQALGSADPVGYPRAYMIFATSDRRHDGRLRQLRMPALFLTGELDANSNPGMSQAMAAQAPLGEAMILPRQRHMMSLVAPELVNMALDRFFRTHALQSSPVPESLSPSR